MQLELVSTATEPDMTTPMLKAFSYEHQDNQRQHNIIHHSKHSRSSLGNNSHHGSSLCNLTPRKDYRQSAETFQLKAALPCGSERGYRQSYTSVCSSGNLMSDAPSSANHGQVSGNQLSSIGIADCISPCSPPHSPSRGEGCESRGPDYLLSRSVDHLERPILPGLSRPGQLLCCGSVDLLSGGGEGYPRVRPTLVIPAHYMRLPGEHPLSGQALLLQTDQQSDLETIQAELNASHSQQPLGQTPTEGTPDVAKQSEGERLGLSESLSIPAALGETALVEINSEDTLLAEKTLMELRGGKPLPHPRAWFVSLDGRSNAHIRHSYIDLQRAGCHGNAPPQPGGHGGGGRRGNRTDTSLDSGVDLNEPRAAGRRGREAEREEREAEKDRSKAATAAAAAYTQLVYVDDLEGGGSEGDTPKCSPQDSKAGLLLSDKAEGPGQEQAEGKRPEGVQIQEEPPSLSSSSPASPPPLPTPEGETFRTDHTLLSVSPDGDAAHEDAEEEKKSPWQRREERPLLAFNLK